jgi:hypothetical protein
MKSKDLRLVVINYYNENKNKVQNIQNEIKHIFNVSHMSLYRWLKNIDHEEMGRPKKSNIYISKKTAYNILHRQNYTHKKVSINRNKYDPDKIKQKEMLFLIKLMRLLKINLLVLMKVS